MGCGWRGVRVRAVLQGKKAALDMRAVLELMMTKVGILRAVVNNLTKHKLKGDYTDDELPQPSLQHADDALAAFIQVRLRRCLRRLLSCACGSCCLAASASASASMPLQRRLPTSSARAHLCLPAMTVLCTHFSRPAREARGARREACLSMLAAKMACLKPCRAASCRPASALHSCAHARAPAVHEPRAARCVRLVECVTSVYR